MQLPVILNLIVVTALVVCSMNKVIAFGLRSMPPTRIRPSALQMEYIPDGLTKAQWLDLQKREKEANKGKNLGAVGITKFQSRSFEAWQKSGMGYLFPVDPKSTPLEKRPYMQRRDGSFDGDDLKKKGLVGTGWGKVSQRTTVDEKYDKMEMEGKLVLYPFAITAPFALPWNDNKPAQNIFTRERAEMLKKKEQTQQTRPSNAALNKATVIRGTKKSGW
eukprot:CAMPEP_0174973538 /NCGR_PEP_ID=MMETSP0004_2-20121128/11300_1 /TAXON_ID=420556 /ORGANISM="Ochromonas sp., Strain CCMP1393" /LENGTH=218 /DNA_ID=CAMNT_0016224003 /DNA_START=53 /DNA_END=706 /DNA_ORIENTATION=-